MVVDDLRNFMLIHVDENNLDEMLSQIKIGKVKLSDVPPAIFCGMLVQTGICAGDVIRMVDQLDNERLYVYFDVISNNINKSNKDVPPLVAQFIFLLYKKYPSRSIEILIENNLYKFSKYSSFISNYFTDDILIKGTDNSFVTLSKSTPKFLKLLETTYETGRFDWNYDVIRSKNNAPKEVLDKIDKYYLTNYCITMLNAKSDRKEYLLLLNKYYPDELAAARILSI